MSNVCCSILNLHPSKRIVICLGYSTAALWWKRESNRSHREKWRFQGSYAAAGFGVGLPVLDNLLSRGMQRRLGPRRANIVSVFCTARGCGPVPQVPTVPAYPIQPRTTILFRRGCCQRDGHDLLVCRTLV